MQASFWARFSTGLWIPECGALVLDGAIVVTGVFSIPLPGFERASAGGGTLRGDARDSSIDRFIAGPENRLLAVATNVVGLAHRASRAMNPLVLCGPAGSGKSHLALGLTRLWQKHQAVRTVSIVEADQLGQPFVPASLRKTTDGSVLVVENVDRLPGTPTAQRNLRSLLDESLALQFRLIVTSRDTPGALDQLPHSVRSRLSGGLVICLSKPSRETRVVIVQAYAAACGVEFTAAAVDLLAQRIEATTGSLVTAVKELAAWLPIQERQAIDTALVERYLADSPAAGRLPISRFAAIVAKQYGTTVKELKGRSRRRGIAASRGVAMYLAHRHGGHSLGSIGKYLGGRDHTTVLHGCRSVEQRLLADTTAQRDIAALTEQIMEENLGV